MGLEGLVESAVHLVVDVLGDVLGGGVDAAGGLVEGPDLVEVGVVELVQDRLEGGFGGVEVADEAVLIEAVALDLDGGQEVVPVEGLLLACDGEGVGGGECRLDGDREHGARVGRLRARVVIVWRMLRVCEDAGGFWTPGRGFAG